MTANNLYESLNVNNVTKKALVDSNFNATPFQIRAISELLQLNKSAVCVSKSKTCRIITYLTLSIELLKRLSFKRRYGTGVLVICATQESADRAYNVLKLLAANDTLRIGVLHTKQSAKRLKLNEGIQILIVTPGRLLKLLQNEQDFNYTLLGAVVFDDIDLIFQLGLKNIIYKILKLIPRKRLNIICNDSNNQVLDSFLIDWKINATFIEDAEYANNIEECIAITNSNRKVQSLYTLLKTYETDGKIVVFFNSVAVLEYLHQYFDLCSIDIICVHGQQDREKRIRIFNHFQKIPKAILFCTDILAHDTKIANVNWIVHFDPAGDKTIYETRIDVIAQDSSKACSVLFLRPEEKTLLNYIFDSQKVYTQMEIELDKYPDFQQNIEKQLSLNPTLRFHAEKAFFGMVNSYRSQNLKDVFVIESLDFKEVATSFGLYCIPQDEEKFKKKVPKKNKKT